MSLSRKWVAECDEPGCTARETFPASYANWEAGESLNDHGWDAAPSHPETYCPAHWPKRKTSWPYIVAEVTS